MVTVSGQGRGRSNGRQEYGKNRGRSKSQGRKIICYYCDEEGHIRWDCPKRKEDKKKKEDKESGEKSSTAGVTEEWSDGDLLLTTSSGTDTSDWILDSGCSFHMCSVREQFATYHECDKGTVRMANDAESKVVGIGTVWIYMFDGIVRTVTRVRHVPDLRNNLISLGTLDARGYRCSFEGGVLKVSKGAML